MIATITPDELLEYLVVIGLGVAIAIFLVRWAMGHFD